MKTISEFVEQIKKQGYVLDCDIREDGRELRKKLYALQANGKLKAIRYEISMLPHYIITDNRILQILKCGQKVSGDVVYVWYVDEKRLPHSVKPGSFNRNRYSDDVKKEMDEDEAEIAKEREKDANDN